MDADLLRHLEGMEKRLREHIDERTLALETRLREGAPPKPPLWVGEPPGGASSAVTLRGDRGHRQRRADP